MEIKNLSQLKKVIAEGHIFLIKQHRVTEFIGQQRQGNVIQTNGFYSIVSNDPENRVSLANGKRGSWLAYGKAKDWEFKNKLCYLYMGEHTENNLVMAFEFLE